MQPEAERETPRLQRSEAKISNGRDEDLQQRAKPASNNSPPTKPLKQHLEEQATQNDERLLSVLRQAGPAGLSPGEARRQAGMIHSTYANVAKRLAASGQVVRDGQRRIFLNPVDWPESWKTPPGARSDLAELRRREAQELGVLPVGNSANLPAVAMTTVDTVLGRVAVAAWPASCPPQHIPSGTDLAVMLMTGRLHPGSPWYCDLCYRGQDVGMWRWTGSRFVTEGSSAGQRQASWIERLMFGRTGPEAETGRRLLAQRAERK